jgi:hypothetical protein
VSYKKLLLSLALVIGLVAPSLFVNVANAVEPDAAICNSGNMNFYHIGTYDLLGPNGEHESNYGTAESYVSGQDLHGYVHVCMITMSGYKTRGTVKPMFMEVGTRAKGTDDNISWFKKDDGNYPIRTHDLFLVPGHGRCLTFHARLEYDGEWYSRVYNSTICN